MRALVRALLALLCQLGSEFDRLVAVQVEGEGHTEDEEKSFPTTLALSDTHKSARILSVIVELEDERGTTPKTGAV